MKKIIFTFLLFLLNISLVFANEIKNIDMDIYLDKNGTGHVTETWDSIASSGTEAYKPFYNLGTSEISNFKVSLNGKEYKYIGNWDINASFNEKSYKNGINYTSNSQELCWGISNYGTNTYVINYDISNMIINTNDGYQVFYWTLIPNDLNPLPDNYSITIHTDDYLPDTLPVWGFGAIDDLAYVYDGEIKLSSENALSSGEYVVALVKFDNNTFLTSNSDDRSFDEFLDIAQEGIVVSKSSSSSSGRFLGILTYIMTIFFTAIVPITLAIGFSSSNNNLKNVDFKDIPKKLEKDYPLFREIPCKKNILAAMFIALSYNIRVKESNFIGCYILKWMKEDIIRIDNTDPKDKKIVLKSYFLPQKYTNSHEIALYKFLSDASKDLVITTKEFKKYCRKNYEELFRWVSNCSKKGKEECIDAGYIIDSVDSKKKYTVTKLFYNEALKIAGLRKFMLEFSDMKNKEPIDVKLWEDYLIFAQMFGIADKVAKRFKELYPDIIEQNSYNYSDIVFISTFNNVAYSSASSARSAAQSYSSGGGGFSSGGGGGGSFGGGGGGGGFR